LYRKLFVGNICILCHRANKRAQEEKGNWKKVLTIKRGNGTEIKVKR